MSKLARKMARNSRVKPIEQIAPSLGPCTHPYCEAPARAMMHCTTCEKIQVEKPKKRVTTINTCREHGEWAIARMKKHVLVAHPVNLVRATAHALKGGTFE